MIGHHAGHWLFALSAGVDALVLGAAAVWGARTRRVLAPAALALAVLGLKGWLLLALGLETPFGVAHVLWLDVVVALPLACLAWVLAGGAARPVVAALGIALAALGVYGSFVEPSRLTVERATVDLPEARAGREPVRIGLLADLQFDRLGGHEREAVERLVAERPDVILLSGDYHQGSDASFERELPALRRLLRTLRAPHGAYAVQGDTDGEVSTRQVFAGTGVRVLHNALARTRVRGRPLTIAGLELAYWSRGARDARRRLERAPGSRDVRLLLSHRPDAAFGLRSRSRVDLTVSGHTHGGQIQLPLLGPLTVASRVPREVGAGGLHDLGGRRLYVSRGVGVERGQAPRVRVGAVPEVSVITLR